MSSQTTNLDLVKPGYEDTADIGDINDNMDALDTAVTGKKDLQTAVTDPTASGTALSFIDTLSQDANGVVTPTKKTVKGMVGAGSSANGAAGLVPQPLIADKDKYLKGDGTWANPPATTYNEATSSNYGLVKIGYTTSGKNYAVQLSSGKMYVNVPWTDNNTTYNQASSSALGLVKIGYSQNGKNYPVALDGSGKMYVNVPWTDTNTTYNNATTSAAGLMSAADKTKLNGITSGATVGPFVYLNGNSALPRLEIRFKALGAQSSGVQSTVNFDTPFTTACIAVIVFDNSSPGSYTQKTVSNWTRTSFQMRVSTGGGANVNVCYIAFGY